jgi:molybdate/tungstate transport system permease protein
LRYARIPRAWLIGIGVALCLAHLVAAFITRDWGTTVSLLTASLFALALAPAYRARWPGRAFWIYPAGYALLFLFMVIVSREPLLFVVFGALYAALYRHPIAIGYLLILIFSAMVITPYWFQSAVLLSLAFTLLLLANRRTRNVFVLACFGAGLLLLGALLLPLFYMTFQTPVQTLLVTLRQSTFVQALLNSFLTATATTVLILLLGVPLAYALVRLEFRGKEALDALVDLPILIPQSVVGIALLALLGPKTPLGEFVYDHFHVKIAASYIGIIACQVFVSSPFLIRSAMNAFEQMGPRLEYVSRTLGATPLSTFFRVSLPLAANAIFAGSILTWARAISEAGSIMILAYHPFTISVLTYDTFVQYGLSETQPVATLLLLVCLWAFIVLRWSRAHPPHFFGRRRVQPA